MIKKILSVLITISAISLAHAREVQLAVYYPPGGGTDRQSEMLVKPLAAEGITVKKRFFKTCIEALNYTKNNPDAYLFGIASDLRNGPTGICPGLKGYPELKFYTTVADSATMFCTASNKPDITFKTLQTSSRPIVVGVLTADANWKPFHLFLNNSKYPLKIKVVPFKGASEIKLALLSNNIDMFFIAGLAQEVVQQGGKCLAASSRKNWANAPFLGDFTNLTNFPETGIQMVIFSNGIIPSDVDAAFKKVLSSDEFAAELTKFNLSHSGIGSGRSTQEQWKELQALDELYSSIP